MGIGPKIFLRFHCKHDEFVLVNNQNEPLDLGSIPQKVTGTCALDFKFDLQTYRPTNTNQTYD